MKWIIVQNPIYMLYIVTIGVYVVMCLSSSKCGVAQFVCTS